MAAIAWAFLRRLSSFASLAAAAFSARLASFDCERSVLPWLKSVDVDGSDDVMKLKLRASSVSCELDGDDLARGGVLRLYGVLELAVGSGGGDGGGVASYVRTLFLV